MPDKMTPEQRHRCMSRIRGKNTRPEILVRKGLHARGFRFRLHDRKLPGSPDLVLPKWGVAILVNGCFWHGHKGCRYATRPKSNEEFWSTKIARNIHRDEVTAAHLEGRGWQVITIWECELKSASTREARLDALAEEIRQAGELLRQRKEERRRITALTRAERAQMRERQARLMEEVEAFFLQIPKDLTNFRKQN
jgi:DNA mismatch endonuclease (patch repair protein)